MLFLRQHFAATRKAASSPHKLQADHTVSARYVHVVAQLGLILALKNDFASQDVISRGLWNMMDARILFVAKLTWLDLISEDRSVAQTSRIAIGKTLAKLRKTAEACT